MIWNPIAGSESGSSDIKAMGGEISRYLSWSHDLPELIRVLNHGSQDCQQVGRDRSWTRLAIWSQPPEFHSTMLAIELKMQGVESKQKAKST